MAERIAIDHDLIVSHAARVEQVASDIKVSSEPTWISMGGKPRRSENSGETSGSRRSSGGGA